MKCMLLHCFMPHDMSNYLVFSNHDCVTWITKCFLNFIFRLSSGSA